MLPKIRIFIAFCGPDFFTNIIKLRGANSFNELAPLFFSLLYGSIYIKMYVLLTNRYSDFVSLCQDFFIKKSMCHCVKINYETCIIGKILL